MKCSNFGKNVPQTINLQLCVSTRKTSLISSILRILNFCTQICDKEQPNFKTRNHWIYLCFKIIKLKMFWMSKIWRMKEMITNCWTLLKCSGTWTVEPIRCKLESKRKIFSSGSNQILKWPNKLPKRKNQSSALKKSQSYLLTIWTWLIFYLMTRLSVVIIYFRKDNLTWKIIQEWTTIRLLPHKMKNKFAVLH